MFLKMQKNSLDLISSHFKHMVICKLYRCVNVHSCYFSQSLKSQLHCMVGYGCSYFNGYVCVFCRVLMANQHMDNSHMVIQVVDKLPLFYSTCCI